MSFLEMKIFMPKKKFSFIPIFDTLRAKLYIMIEVIAKIRFEFLYIFFLRNRMKMLIQMIPFHMEKKMIKTKRVSHKLI